MNPDDLIRITPEEIERQAQEALKIMKKNTWELHSENKWANKIMKRGDEK